MTHNLKEIYKDVFENPTAVLDYITINGQDYNISKALRAITDANWKQTAEELKRIPGTFKFNQETSKKEFAGIIGKKIQEMKIKTISLQNMFKHVITCSDMFWSEIVLNFI